MFPCRIKVCEKEACSLWRSRIPKVLCPMTLIMTLTLQMMGFGRKKDLTLSLSFSLEVEDDCLKPWKP